jgi:threonine dehydrogenase-like Zn-dependent dehydrogenase
MPNTIQGHADEKGAARIGLRHDVDDKLRDLIATDRATPSVIISHELLLEKAPGGCQRFDARDNGWTKAVLKPVT